MKQIRKLKRLYILLLVPLSFFLTYLAKHNSFFTEQVFAKRIYRVYSIVFSNIMGVFPFSIGEFLIVLLPIALTACFVCFVRKIIKKKEERGYLIRKGILNAGCFLSILLFLYTIGCGLNYYRYTFSEYANLTIQDSSVEELYDMCRKLASQANELRRQIKSEDVDQTMKLSVSMAGLKKELMKAYQSLSKEYPVLSGSYPGGKPVLFSRVMSRMEITGVFFPFTMEANVNVDIPDYSIPATMGHEMAHMRGFMREDEANYISYLACLASDDPEIQYSGVMLALIISENALYDEDKNLYYELSASYDNKVRIDTNANSDYWRQFENQTISVTASKINNAYLMINDQEDGVKSYGRMVDLLLAEYRASQQ